MWGPSRRQRGGLGPGRLGPGGLGPGRLGRGRLLVSRHRRLITAALVGLSVLAGISAVRVDRTSVPVLVAARDLGPGTLLRAEDLTTFALPAAAVPAGALRTSAGGPAALAPPGAGGPRRGSGAPRRGLGPRPCRRCPARRAADRRPPGRTPDASPATGGFGGRVRAGRRPGPAVAGAARRSGGRG